MVVQQGLRRPQEKLKKSQEKLKRSQKTADRRGAGAFSVSVRTSSTSRGGD
jgi:hypothetical protein